MSDKIINVSSAVNTVGTTTAYTVPTGKAFRGTFKFVGTAAAAGSSTLALLANGATQFTSASIVSGSTIWSTSLLPFNASQTAPDGSATSKIVSPYTGAQGNSAAAPYSLYLAAGQSIQYTIGTTALASFVFEVQGAEVDAT